MAHVFRDPKYADAERRARALDPILLEMGDWTARAEDVRSAYILDTIRWADQRIYAYVTWTGTIPQEAEFGYYFTLWGYAAARSSGIAAWFARAFGTESHLGIKTSIREVKRSRATVETFELQSGGLRVSVHTALGVDAVRAIETPEQADAAARILVQSELSMLAYAFSLDDPSALMPERLPVEAGSIRGRLCWPADPEILAGYEKEASYRALLRELDERPSSRWPVEGKPPIRPKVRPLPTNERSQVCRAEPSDTNP